MSKRDLKGGDQVIDTLTYPFCPRLGTCKMVEYDQVTNKATRVLIEWPDAPRRQWVTIDRVRYIPPLMALAMQADQ